MKVIVSACLLGVPCKYNGESNLNEKVLQFVEDKDVIRVCPEVLGGMSTPRHCAEIKNGKIVDSEGRNVHEAYESGVNMVMTQIEGESIECAILMSRSPTCGVHQIYDGSFTGKLIAGQGILAKALIEAGICVIDVSDL